MTYIAIFVGVLVVFMFITKKSTPLISSEDARNLIEKGAVLIDVRTPSEFKNGHIEGAKNIPLQEIGKRSADVGKKTETVVLYCRSGARSSGALKILKKVGFENLHNLGSMRRW